MHGEANVGEGVFDFSAIVKAETTDEFVANAAAAKDFLEGTGLEVGAVFDGASLVGVVVENFLEFSGDKFSFGLCVAGFEVAKVFASGRFGFQRFAETVGIIFYDRAGRVENILRRAIVTFEANDARCGEITGEAEQGGNDGAAPTVDGLVFVAESPDISFRSGEEAV